MAGPEKIRITCDGCNVALKVSPRLAGKQIACPQCGAPVEVPQRGRRRTARRSPTSSSSPRGARAGAGAAPAALHRARRPRPPWLQRRRPELEPIAPSHPLSRYAHGSSSWPSSRSRSPSSATTVRERFECSLAQVDPAVLERMPAEAGLDELMAVLPGHKLVGAHLPRGSSAHWAYAGRGGPRLRRPRRRLPARPGHLRLARRGGGLHRDGRDRAPWASSSPTPPTA